MDHPVPMIKMQSWLRLSRLIIEFPSQFRRQAKLDPPLKLRRKLEISPLSLEKVDKVSSSKNW